MDIAAIQNRLKEGIAKGDLAPVLKNLREMLPEASPRYNEVVVLQGRLNDANRKRLREELTQDELQKAYALIRIELLALIDGLTPADFDPNAKPAGKEVRRGHVLYRVPNVMRQDEETRCIVRIAQDEDRLVEDLDLDEHIRTREIRISNTMQVELIDPSGEAAFRIRTISEAVQLIDEDDFTEWYFFVTPLRSGIFPLVLKVSIIELVDGLPRKREKVMEARVEVITEGPLSDEEPAFQSAGYAFAYSSGTLEGLTVNYQPTPVYSPERQAPQPPHYQPSVVIAPAPQRTRGGSGLRRTALLLAALLAVSSATWAITPAAERDWLWTRYVQNSAAAYEAYIQKYEGNDERRLEQAYWRKAVLIDAPEAYLDYLERYPEAEAAARAEVTLPKLEQSIFAQLERKPTPESLRTFLQVFPESGQAEQAQFLLDSLDQAERISPGNTSTLIPGNDGTTADTLPSDTRSAESPGKVSDGDKTAPLKEALQKLEKAAQEPPKQDPPKQEPESNPESLLYGSVTDPAGRRYRTLRLAGKTWLAQNLDYDLPGSSWYHKDLKSPSEQSKYGRLYTWEAAKKACAALGKGWRLPTDEEWTALTDKYGGNAKAYDALMEGGSSGFSALLGGSRNVDGSFGSLGGYGYYWSATENDTGYAWAYAFYRSSGVLNRYGDLKGIGLSCRCAQGAPSNGND